MSLQPPFEHRVQDFGLCICFLSTGFETLGAPACTLSKGFETLACIAHVLSKGFRLWTRQLDIRTKGSDVGCCSVLLKKRVHNLGCRPLTCGACDGILNVSNCTRLLEWGHTLRGAQWAGGTVKREMRDVYTNMESQPQDTDTPCLDFCSE